MNKSIVKIGQIDVTVKEYKGKRVVTFKDIDQCHNRPEGTAGRNFRENKKHMIDSTDFFMLKPSDIQNDEIRRAGSSEKRTIGIRPEDVNNRGTVFITESGYLMLVKSFTDDLAWDVQRQLVNTYFRKGETKVAPAKRSLGETNAAARIIMPTLKDANMPPQYRAVVLQGLYKSIGVEIPLDGIKTDKQLFNCTEIAEKLGIMSKAGKPHNQAVAAIIAQLPISEDEKSLVPFQSQISGHAGPTYQYTKSVVDKVSAWLIEHNYPANVSCGGKSYKAAYKFKPGIVEGEVPA